MAEALNLRSLQTRQSMDIFPQRQNGKLRWGKFGTCWHQTERNPVKSTQCVGYLRPNEHGLYDMSGNVWEWCQDVYQHIFWCQRSTNKRPRCCRVRKGGSG